MIGRPDFSPPMLALFLRARVAHAHHCRPARCGMQATRKRELAALRRLSGLTGTEIEFAWMGRLCRAAPRAALWAVFGHFPRDHGMTLTDGGGQADV